MTTSTQKLPVTVSEATSLLENEIKACMGLAKQAAQVFERKSSLELGFFPSQDVELRAAFKQFEESLKQVHTELLSRAAPAKTTSASALAA